MFGHLNLLAYYPTSRHLASGLNQAWSHVYEDDNKEFKFFFCVDYFHGKEMKDRIFLQHGMVMESIYSSLRDNLNCFAFHSNSSRLSSVVNAIIPLQFLIPRPNYLKLDISLMSLVLSHYSHDDSLIQTAMSSCGDTMKFLHKSQHRLLCHPILSDLSTMDIDLSVTMRSGMSKTIMLEFVQNIASAFDETHHTRSRNISQQFAEFCSAQRLLHQNIKSKNANVRYDELFYYPRHDGLNGDEFDLTDAFSKIWTHFLDLTLYEPCKYSHLVVDVTYRKRDVIFHLTRDAVKSAPFLFSLAAMAAESADVVAIALSPRPRLLNNNARLITQFGTTNAEDAAYFLAGLRGHGQIVGVCDTGIDQESCFFIDKVNGKVPVSSVDNPVAHYKYRKVVQYVNYSGSSGDWSYGHGSHVSGTIAGNCYDNMNGQQTYNGIASDAKLAMFDIGLSKVGSLDIPTDLTMIYQTTKSAGGLVHSNSWGGSYWYDSFAIETDVFLYNNDDMTLVFAAGNSGGNGIQTILSPAVAKNTIAVAASHNAHGGGGDINHLAMFSSVGPAPDGRIKPDITAPGYSLMSAAAASELGNSQTCDVTYKPGTSMAAPVVGGNVALVHQYFSNSSYWASVCSPTYPHCKDGSFTPKGSLVKALILHSGDIMTQYQGSGSLSQVPLNSIPDFFQGYGRLTLSNILPLKPYENTSESYSLFVETFRLVELSEIVIEVDIERSDAPFRVTISWYDPPIEVFAAKVLVHDIDLVIVNPKGEIFYGNTPSSSIETGKSPPASNRDEMNNNEQIFIKTPEMLGRWIVRVQAKHLTYSDFQDVSIVITSPGEVKEFNETCQPLDISYLDACSLSSQWSDSAASVPKTQIGFSLWSLVSRSAWSDSTSYDLSLQSNATPIYSSKWSDASVHRMYREDDMCLNEGCYGVQLNLNEDSVTGTQLSIPGCASYLSPLTTVQSFCIHNTSLLSLVDAIGIQSGNAGSCVSSCQLSTHIRLPVTLAEDYGEGWNGAYFAVQFANHEAVEMADVSVTSGSLQWGFYDDRSICLLAESRCYFMELSVPNIDDLDPYVLFPTAYLSGDSGRGDCPFELKRDVSTLAKICVNVTVLTASITFLQPTETSPYPGPVFGQTYATLDELMSIFDVANTAIMGECIVSLDITSSLYINSSKSHGETNAPSYFPTIYPSTYPSYDATVRPTISPTAVYDCLNNCHNYDSNLFSDNHISSSKPICDYLLEYLFTDCTSYSIGSGLCQIPSCAQNCSVQTWCYYAAASSILCSDSSQEVFENLQSQCVSSYGTSIQMNDDHGDDHDNNFEVSPQNTATIKNKDLFGKLDGM